MPKLGLCPKTPQNADGTRTFRWVEEKPIPNYLVTIDVGVTDSGLARAPITTAALDSLLAAGLGAALFSDLKPNPIEANLLAGLEAYRVGNHDGVVAFGGGSGLDMGKLIAFMSGQSRPVWDSIMATTMDVASSSRTVWAGGRDR